MKKTTKKSTKVDNITNPNQYLTPNEIKDSLWRHGWLNNTLSPVTTKQFWDITKDIVPVDEVPYSALFALSNASSLIHRIYVFIATNKRVILIVNTAGVITTKDFGYDEFTAIDLYVDVWLNSLIYCDMYLSKFRFYKLETNDPTSALDFRKTVLDMQTSPKGRLRFKPIAGTVDVTVKMSKYLWQKFTYLLNWSNYHKKFKAKKDEKISKRVIHEDKELNTNKK